MTADPQRCVDDAKDGSMVARVAYTAATDGANDWPASFIATALAEYGLRRADPSQFNGCTFVAIP